jgi:hypothetical protein
MGAAAGAQCLHLCRSRGTGPAGFLGRGSGGSPLATSDVGGSPPTASGAIAGWALPASLGRCERTSALQPAAAVGDVLGRVGAVVVGLTGG